MTFRNPVMLVGLAAALVPLVLHFLNRARYRNVEWGAMMFLDAMEPRAYHSARLKQWLLLIGRATILGTLAAAMARPVLSAAAGTPPARQGRTAAVFLLDASGSMSLNDNGRVRLDVARETIFQLLSPGLKRGDDLYLIPLGDHDPRAPRPHATDPQDMARRVKEVATASGRADVAAGLIEAAELLSTSQAPNHEIYVITDRQAGSWGGVGEADFLRRWQTLTTGPAGRPRVMVVPVGTEEIDNVAVEAIESASAEPFVANQGGDVEVRLHNYGAVPRTAARLDVRVHTPTNRTVQARQVDVNLPAGAVTRVTVPLTFPEAGANIVTATIDAPGLSTDKQFNRAIDVLANLRVLIIDGDEREGAFRNATDYLRAALNPYHNDKRDPAILAYTRPDIWTPADLANVRVVIAANVASFTEAQARALEQFVWDGGGLVVAPGDQVRAENYNAQFPWLPASLAAPTAESEAGATTLGPVDPGHPIFGFLKGRADSAPPVPVRRYFPTAPRAGSDVVARFADASAFIVTRDVGYGRAVLLTTPVDPDWNAVPLTNVFLPLAQNVVRYSAGGPAAVAASQHNLPAGRTVVANFPELLDPKQVSVWALPGSPKSDPTRLAVTQSEYGTQATYDGAHLPGVYRISPRPQPADPRTQLFAMNPPLTESDLTPLTDEQWDRMANAVGFARIDPERRPPNVAQEGYREGLDLWLPLVGLAVVLSVIELSATRRWAGRDEP